MSRNLNEETCGNTIDILVNNATGPQPELSIEDSTWNDYLFVKAPLLLTKAILPGMKKKREGKIITICSEVVQLGNPNFANYVTVKSSQVGMTSSWASDIGNTVVFLSSNDAKFITGQSISVNGGNTFGV